MRGTIDRRRTICGLRAVLFSVALAAFSCQLAPPVFAAGGIYGTLSGTVVDASTQKPIAAAEVDVASASGKYSAKTDSAGNFVIVGVNVDTYVVSVTAPGHQTFVRQAVTVYGDQTNPVGTLALQPSLVTIGTTVARSVSSAYQPAQTTDAYTVNANQIVASTGKAFSSNEIGALLSVPGVTLTDNSTATSQQVTIRGGAAFEVGYQFDGVPFREPFYNGNGAFGLMNGVGSMQVVEGAADATQAGVGSGVINIIPQRGSGPGSGTLDFEAGGPKVDNQVGLSYGFSTPDNRISEYFSYIGQDFEPYYGYSFTNIAAYGNYFGTQHDENSQILNNFFYKFGKDQNQQIQVLYLNDSQLEYQGVTGAGGVYNQLTNPGALAYYPYDTLTQGYLAGLLGYTPAQYAGLIGLTPDVPAYNQPITQPQQNISNQAAFLKLEYDNNLSATTYLALRYYNWQYTQSQDTTSSLGAWNGGFPGLAYQSATGGSTTGLNLDLVHEFGTHLTVTLNGQYDVLRPLFTYYQPQIEAIGLAYGPTLAQSGAGLANPPAAADWLPGGYIYNYFANNAVSVPTADCSTLAVPAGFKSNCLPRIPSWGINYNGTIFQNWGTGLAFQYNPSTKLRFDVGARVEGQNQQWYGQLDAYGQGAPATGTCVGLGTTYCGANAGGAVAIKNPFDVPDSSWSNQVLHPVSTEPRGSVSYELGNDDSIRFSYGRSTVFADAQTAGTPLHLYGVEPYLGVPAVAGSTCGNVSTATFPCASYGAQLYWLGDQTANFPDAGGGIPANYSNYDLSYNHLFRNGMGLRITPFFKVGTTLPAYVLLNPILDTYQVANQGYNKTTGTELDLTTLQRAVGFTGFFAATYQNVLSTTPPLAFDENQVPTVPTASLVLGDLYRAGYVSPATFRIGGVENLKSGFSINAQIESNVGYPYTIGNLIAAQLPNGSYANVPQVDFGPGITGGQASLIGDAPGAAVATNYYDPADPGSALHPNIAATRGTPATANNGGGLSHWNMVLNLTFQYRWQRNTLGVQFLNLGGNAWEGTIPAANPWYQPVANGLSGPQTGYESCVQQVGAGLRGCYVNVPYDAYAFTNGAYLLTNGNSTTTTPTLGPTAPDTVELFYQLRL